MFAVRSSKTIHKDQKVSWMDEQDLQAVRRCGTPCRPRGDVKQADRKDTNPGGGAFAGLAHDKYQPGIFFALHLAILDTEM